MASRFLSRSRRSGHLEQSIDCHHAVSNFADASFQAAAQVNGIVAIAGVLLQMHETHQTKLPWIGFGVGESRNAATV